MLHIDYYSMYFLYKPTFTLLRWRWVWIKQILEINKKKIIYKQYDTPYQNEQFSQVQLRLGYHTATILTDFILEGWLNPHTDIKMSNINCGHVKIHYDEIQRRWYVVILLTNHCPYKTSFFPLMLCTHTYTHALVLNTSTHWLTCLKLCVYIWFCG